MQVHRRDQRRLLAYKPALKQRAELQVSGSEQLQHVTTGQLSYGNRLLSRTIQPPNQGRRQRPLLTRVQEAESTQAARYHGSADPSSTLTAVGRSKRPLCLQTDLQLG